MYAVLVPSAVLARYLDLEARELARDVCRALAVDPRPSWARQVPVGWYVDLGGGERLLYDVDDEEQLVRVTCAGRRFARAA